MKLVRERTKEEIEIRTYESITAFIVFIKDAYLRRAFLALRLALVNFDFFLVRVKLIAIVGKEAEIARLQAEKGAGTVVLPVKLEVEAIIRVVK